MAKFCSNCGTQLSEDTKFCTGCGARQDDAAQPAAPQQPAQQQPIVQQQYQQAPYQQQPYAYAAPKKKSKLPLILAIVFVSLAAVVTGIVLLAGSLLGKAAKADYYEIGKDRIPSVKFALGEERKVTGDVTSISGKVIKKEIQYKVSGSDQGEEMWEYYSYLHEHDGFLRLGEIDFDGQSGIGLIGRNSADEGYELQMQIKYDRRGYTITIIKQPGGITPAEQDGSLTEGILKIFGSGTFHMKVKAEGVEMEAYVKNGMTAVAVDAEGMEDVRMVLRDGQHYMIYDSLQTVVVGDASEGFDFSGFGETADLKYISSGSGEFNGKTHSYDEYEDKGTRILYYAEDGNFRGMRTIEGNEINDIVFLALDGNVPDGVFDIPSDYRIY